MKIIVYNTMVDEIPWFKMIEKGNPKITFKMTKDPLNDQTLYEAKGCDGLTTHSIPHDAEFYPKLAKLGLKQIDMRHTGYEAINLKAATKNHLIATNVSAYSPRAVSELVLTHVMYLLRHIGLLKAKEQKGNFLWTPDVRSKEIHDLTVGIIGTGKIGSAVARIFKALGCEVLANDIEPTTNLEATVKYVSKDTIFKKSDVITLHTPLTKLTYHMVGAKQFKEMKNSVIFINASRGDVVDTPALIKALDTKEISAAGIDVLEEELSTYDKDLHGKPIPDKYVTNLMNRPNVLLTPHIGFYTDNAMKNSIFISVKNILQVLQGKPVENQVN